MCAYFERSQKAGELTSAALRFNESWGEIVHDTFCPGASGAIRESLLLGCGVDGEYECLPHDGQLKACLHLIGQVGRTAQKCDKELYALPQKGFLRTAHTLRGRSGAVVGVEAHLSEKSEHQVNVVKNAMADARKRQVVHWQLPAPRTNFTPN